MLPLRKAMIVSAAAATLAQAVEGSVFWAEPDPGHLVHVQYTFGVYLVYDSDPDQHRNR